MGKRGFIAGALIDFFWAPLLFVLIAVLFYLIFSFVTESKLQEIEDSKDVAYGNYLAQVYLRKPLSVGSQRFTVAELIALYDYNQTLEKKKNKSYAEFIEDKYHMLIGQDNPMRQALIKFSEEYVDKNFNSGNCYVFGVHGNAIEYNYMSGNCPSSKAFSAYYLLSQMRKVPANTYATFIAPVDPRQTPIVLYSIYDIERLLALYSDDPYFDLSDAQRWSIAALCMDPVNAVVYSTCRDKYGAAYSEATK
ncbi:hypothetical protein KY363_04055 [Candidatus Woesearchaeota archaeon]|nr:hypothetical protein [Candidatus Woesearchaeota archaeon]